MMKPSGLPRFCTVISYVLRMGSNQSLKHIHAQHQASYSHIISGGVLDTKNRHVYRYLR